MRGGESTSSTLPMLSDLIVMARFDGAVRRFAFLLFIAATPALAQEQPSAVPQTREAVIAAEREDKVAELWPERQNAMVDIVNGLGERGLGEGLDSGKGANGIQFLFGGMRSGQGMSGGVGYRRSDLFREQLGIRDLPRQPRRLPRHHPAQRHTCRQPRTSPRLRLRALPRRPQRLDRDSHRYIDELTTRTTSSAAAPNCAAARHACSSAP